MTTDTPNSTGSKSDARRLAEEFVAAMGRLERDRDPSALVALYAPNGSAGRLQERGTRQGRDGIEAFWAGYRTMFGDIESSYRAIITGADAAALEWTTRATIDGRSLDSEGVTILEIADHQIVRSTAYFDPSKLGRQLQDDPTDTSAAGDATPAPPDETMSEPRGQRRPDVSDRQADDPTGHPGGNLQPMPNEWEADPEDVG